MILVVVEVPRWTCTSIHTLEPANKPRFNAFRASLASDSAPELMPCEFVVRVPTIELRDLLGEPIALSFAVFEKFPIFVNPINVVDASTFHRVSVNAASASVVNDDIGGINIHYVGMQISTFRLNTV